MQLRILYFTIGHADYLSDSLLIGLKQLDNVNVFEYPKNAFIYKNDELFTNRKNGVYGKGFTLYNLLPKSSDHQFVELRPSEYDLYIFGSIWHQYGLFLQMQKYLTPQNTILIDGADTPAIMPYHGNFWRDGSYFRIPKLHKKFRYFKREWTEETKRYRYFKYLPEFILKLLPDPQNLALISFSIPEEKIIETLPVKTKLFPTHIVDPDVAEKVGESQTSYAFSREEDYYRDIQAAKFGITTKRAGWDCMRHYEIGANGTVICFRDLDKKPATSAPHGLIPGQNCISYHSYADLKKQIDLLDDQQYLSLQRGSWEWAKANSCKNRAKEFLRICQKCMG